jgi:hypothetical protein
LCDHNKTFKNEGGIMERELDLNIFSTPFNVDCEQVKPSLQLELIELTTQHSTEATVSQHLKVGVLQDLAKIELSKFDMSRPEDHVRVCFLIFVRTSFFQHEASKKQC